jgi:hypothetical protein
MPTPHRHLHRIPHGSIYVVALSFGLLLAVIGLGAIAAARSYDRAQDRMNDAADARNYAFSAVEVARRQIATDPNWRTDNSNGTWFSSQPIGSGTMSVQVVNPNGPLNNADNDPVIITALGFKGTARQMLTVTLTANTAPLTCLGVGLYCGGGGSFSNATVGGTSTMSSGGTLTLTSSTFNANRFEALAIVPVGCTGMGPQTILSTGRTLPSSTALSYYTSHGTAISYASLPNGGTLQQCLLSPNSNPFGSQPDPQGIYVIDCGGQNITIQNVRVVGTLVLLNTSNSSIIQGSVNMAPVVNGFPALLVNGSIQIGFTSAPLAETTAGNLNPPGTPYNGVSNTTASDSYPSIIQGLVYVSGNVSLTSGASATFKGNLITAGTLSVQGTLNMTYDPSNQTPPPGFFTTPPPMVVSPGTWARVVN